MFKSKQQAMFASLLLMAAASLQATSSVSAVAPDNSRVNEYDLNGLSKTSEHQSSKPQDIELTRRIREELVKDDSLSTYGQNIKVITTDGKVTLRGPVRSIDEKTKIEAKAYRIAGKNAVESDLQITK